MVMWNSVLYFFLLWFKGHEVLLSETCNQVNYVWILRINLSGNHFFNFCSSCFTSLQRSLMTEGVFVPYHHEDILRLHMLCVLCDWGTCRLLLYTVWWCIDVSCMLLFAVGTVSPCTPPHTHTHSFLCFFLFLCTVFIIQVFKHMNMHTYTLILTSTCNMKILNQSANLLKSV